MWNNLTEARRQSGLSQQEVAEALDISRQAVSRWETGAAAPSTEKLIELARLYGVTLDALVNGSAPEAGSAAANEAPRRKIQWGWIAAAALVIAVLAVIIGAYFLGRGESDVQIVDSGDMEREEITNIEDIGSVPWENE